VAHDFNNMLGVILGHAQLALRRVSPEEPVHASLTEIHKAASRSAGLTRQLLGFARRQTVTPRVLDLNETVTGMLEMLGRLIGEDISLHWRPGADLWPVWVDPSQIDQVMANLCVNARDAISNVGKLTIETRNCAFNQEYCTTHAGFVPGEYVLLAVSDNGCGMDKETLAQLFEPFFTTKEIGKGTGLGLATVYGIVKQNQGFIYVCSEPGSGTTFTIHLPRYVGKAEPMRTEGTTPPAERGQETILLVEDEPAILEMVTAMLELQGYTVLGASTPGEAICLARERVGEIHLLMTDVVMPEMNGRELARNLLSLHPHLKRIFMSGYTSDVIAHHGVLDEGVHFLQKPFSIEDLAARVRETLDRG
jgi:two-component system cell cycle sensor histidine kinase/response regulator CckA